ncbi:MAG: RNA polymerase subunit sigma [Candidatus Accumulibacter sp.]|nr:RNA polymerase subunit sigma [Accumulibacter sp.]
MADDPNLSSRRARFEALALPHLDAAFNLARWLARDSDDARDIVQEAFLRAFDAFDGLRGDNARPWLLAIVRNTCFTWLAHNRGARGQVPYEESQHAQSDPTADPAWLALRADERQRVDAAIEHLPPEFREVVVLRELDDLSYKEIAGVLSIPVGTVMSRLARGRHLLARYLTADGGGEL